MTRPQFGKFSALLQKVRAQISSLHLVADLVVQRPFGLQEALRMNLRNPIHERRAEAMHGISRPYLCPEQRLHGVVRLAA
jgi:hypothetical protein